MIKKLSLAAGFLFSLSSTAMSDVITYDCDLHKYEPGWVSDKVIVSIDAEEKRARVYDAFIHHIDGVPMDVKFKTTRNGEYRLLWKKRIPEKSGQSIYVSYTGTLNPETQEMKLIARFPQVNAINRPKGIGPCKILDGSSLYQ